MEPKVLTKYMTIIFIVATFIGVFHHHNDLKQHNDCQICAIQSSLANADTPIDVLYLTKIDVYFLDIIAEFPVSHQKESFSTLGARAPPYNS